MRVESNSAVTIQCSHVRQSAQTCSDTVLGPVRNTERKPFICQRLSAGARKGGTFQVGSVVLGGQLPDVGVHRDGCVLVQREQAHARRHLDMQAQHLPLGSWERCWRCDCEMLSIITCNTDLGTDAGQRAQGFGRLRIADAPEALEPGCAPAILGHKRRHTAHDKLGPAPTGFVLGTWQHMRLECMPWGL